MNTGQDPPTGLISAIGPSEVHVLPGWRCRQAAWQIVVATINTVIFSSSFFFLSPLLFPDFGLCLGC